MKKYILYSGLFIAALIVAYFLFFKGKKISLFADTTTPPNPNTTPNPADNRDTQVGGEALGIGYSNNINNQTNQTTDTQQDTQTGNTQNLNDIMQGTEPYYVVPVNLMTISHELIVADLEPTDRNVENGIPAFQVSNGTYTSQQRNTANIVYGVKKGLQALHTGTGYLILYSKFQTQQLNEVTASFRTGKEKMHPNLNNNQGIQGDLAYLILTSNVIDEFETVMLKNLNGLRIDTTLKYIIENYL